MSKRSRKNGRFDYFTEEKDSKIKVNKNKNKNKIKIK